MSVIVEYMAYERLDPFGGDRGDLRAAIVANTVARSQSAKTQIKDFMPRWTENIRQAQPLEDMIAILKSAKKLFQVKEEKNG